MIDDFTQYRRKQIAELRPWVIGDDMSRVSVSAPDMAAGSPKVGDMIARNPKNHADQWLVAAQYFADNFEPVSAYDALSRDGMREALAPFAKAAEMFAWPVAEPDSCAIAPGTKLTVGDLRRARDLLSPDAPRQKVEG